MIPAITFIWDGDAMIPHRAASRLAERSFTSGHAYRLIVAEEAERRSGEQNKKMWAMLTDIATQITLAGQTLTIDEWKVVFLHALGREIKFLPPLHGSGCVPYGQQSSILTKREMTELIELIQAEGTMRGVVFKDDPVNHEQTG